MSKREELVKACAEVLNRLRTKFEDQCDDNTWWYCDAVDQELKQLEATK